MKRLLLALMMAWGLVLSPLMAGGAFAQDLPPAQKEQKAPEAQQEADAPPADENAKDEAKDSAGEAEPVKEVPAADRERAKNIENVEDAAKTAKAAYDAFKNGNIVHGIAFLVFILIFLIRLTPLKDKFKNRKWWLAVQLVASLLGAAGWVIVSAPTGAEIDWWAALDGVGRVVGESGGIWGVLKVFGLDAKVKPQLEDSAPS